MGPHYDNDTGRYFKLDEVMNAHWLLDDETDALYLVPREEDGFDIYGPDKDVEKTLCALSDEELSDDALMQSKGFTLIYPVQRRFDEKIGYYYA